MEPSIISWKMGTSKPQGTKKYENYVTILHFCFPNGSCSLWKPFGDSSSHSPIFSWKFDCKHHSDSLINIINRQKKTRHVTKAFQSEKTLCGIDMFYQNLSPLNSGDGPFSAAEKLLTAWHLEVQRCFLVHVILCIRRGRLDYMMLNIRQIKDQLRMSTGYTPRKRGVRHPASIVCFSGSRCNLGFAKLSLSIKPRRSSAQRWDQTTSRNKVRTIIKNLGSW